MNYYKKLGPLIYQTKYWSNLPGKEDTVNVVNPKRMYGLLPWILAESGVYVALPLLNKAHHVKGYWDVYMALYLVIIPFRLFWGNWASSRHTPDMNLIFNWTIDEKGKKTEI